MRIDELLKAIDAETARAFVQAARSVIDAMLIEAARIEETQTPAVIDYEHAALSREAPAGGWISHAELRRTTQQMAEAMAAEKWVDGMLAAIRLLRVIGG